ncbi:outer membrane lipoprotein LolB [Aliidiomarina minuta]|uniref:Outer-membrane lipoprotein LolB n=1 Tax=Aliidiomarina minuta TaxID=880057 RepID=A0A432W5I5_9GAMM|nr:lipoprotein insertase outer membrane protein LolB [Aliidiomarina minuta]RUO25330.1 outer membrane lipoprotein LolB [Aliidiomarina minuta]
MRHICFLMLITLFLTACASRPDSVSETDADQQLIATHQAQLADIDNWEFQARMAFFNFRDNERHSASIRWQQAPESLYIRISHPLRGTLAQLEQQPGYAILTDDDDNQYYARDVSELLVQNLNIYLPVELINDALLGRHPGTRLLQPRYFEDGSLASYQVDVSEPGQASDRWSVLLSNYAAAQNHSALVPHSLELESSDYRIRLNISRWQIISPEDETHYD